MRTPYTTIAPLSLLILLSGCALQDEPQGQTEPRIVYLPWEEPAEQPAYPTEPNQPNQPNQPTAPVEPAQPVTPAHCAQPSLAGAPLIQDAAPAPGPTLIERFDAQGCVADRNLLTYDAQGRVIAHDYDIFDPNLQFQTYMQVVSFRQRNIYDAAGNLVRITKTAPDGALIYEEQTRYNAQGKPLKQTRNRHHIDFPSEGVSEELWSYHPSGEIAARQVFYDGQLVDQERFTRDEAGRPLERSTLVYDNDRTPTLRAVARWAYDPQGRAVRVETLGAGEQLTALTTNTYRPDGTLSERREDQREYGWINQWRYDLQGREIYYHQDSNRDGRPDYITERDFNDAGEVVLEQTRYEHNGRSYASNYVTRRTFDDQNRPLLHLTQSMANGRQWSSETQWTWLDDTTATRVHITDASDAPRRVTSRATVTIGATGEIALSEQHTDADGNPSIDITRTIDAQGRLLSEEYISSNYAWTRTWRYDAAGRVVSERVDDPSGSHDGTLGAETRYR